MHRTTILLPLELRKSAEAEARSIGISLGELIRRRLQPTEQRQKKELPAFFTREIWRDRGPADLSVSHDQYLYGE